MNQAQSNRPAKVDQAVMLLYSTLAVGVVRSLVEVPDSRRLHPWAS